MEVPGPRMPLPLRSRPQEMPVQAVRGGAGEKRKRLVGVGPAMEEEDGWSLNNEQAGSAT